MKRILELYKRWRRKREAKRNGVPFRNRMWYNYRAMLPKSELPKKSFIEIFDADGRYIPCPSIGCEVIYNDRGTRYRYLIVGFDNDSRSRDWLYDDDWINPIVEYIGKEVES